MPTYVYICQKCGHQFEKFQPMSATPLSVCTKEACPEKRWGKGKVKRAISGGAGLIFKGSGFYITDYRSDKYKEAAKKDSSTHAASDSKSSGTADSKKAAPAKTESHAKPPPAKTT
jgi:putative FmdB family regulatory protein